MSSNDGINITENFASASAPERSARTQVPQPPPVQPVPEKSPSSRAEMKGPSDIDSILSNLKTKKVSMTSSSPPPSTQDINDIDIGNLVNDSSTISISDLKEMQSISASAPKKSRRRRGSDKNTISLDI